MPAELLDFDLKLFSATGFAEAVPVPGCSFHGVLHCVDDEMIDTLGKIEAGYNRVEGIARTYDGSKVCAIVYSANKELEELSKQPTNLLTERYISIMVEGAKNFGVKQCHIDYLENCDFVPRALLHEFKPFEERNDDLPLITYDDDVKPSYDGTKSPVIRTTTNGKAKARISLSIDDFMHQMTISLIKLHGHAEKIFLSKVSMIS